MRCRIEQNPGSTPTEADEAKSILVYSHDPYGLGSIRRMLEITRHLVDNDREMSALSISGSPMLHAFRIPAQIDYVKLPCLANLGFRWLSREPRAEPLWAVGLQELPVAVDWCRRENGKPANPVMLAARVAEALRADGPLGIMLRHAAMGKVEQDRLAELVAVLSGRSGGRVRLLCQLIRIGDSAGPVARAGRRA